MGYARSRRLAANLFAGPWCVGFLAFTLCPLLFSLYASFCRWTVGFTMPWVGLANYQRILAARDFWRCGGTTVLYGLIGTPVTLAFALLLAVLINQKVKGVKFFRALYFLPVVAASDVISTAAGVALFGRIIVIGVDLSFFGVRLTSGQAEVLQIGAMLLTLSLWRTGIQMLIFLLGLENVPADLYEAAQMDGATGWQKFWWVTMPAISPLILLNVLLTVVESFTSLATTMRLLTGGYLQLFIWDYIDSLAFRRLDFSGSLAATWLAVIFLLALIAFLFQRMSRSLGRANS
ncbi:MAG: carbohydrate ABC transporter permease [Patescibacteria group bacterium]